ncbi:MAG TPA: cupredoxin domain-containing protein [Candidatus Angelobacter sp.]|nr:cupredoxin domain-containing protein [Candidatus Angelobacter sp.]
MSPMISLGLAVASVATMVMGLTGAGPGPAHGEPSTIVRVELTEYALTPARVTLQVGKPITLKVVNRGRMTHMFASSYLASRDLEVEGGEMEVDAPNGIKYVKLRPGKSAEIKFTPEARGTFDMECDMTHAGRLHRELGMKGVVVVE